MPKKREAVDGFGDQADILSQSRLFLSAEQTGNSNPQNVAHGLGKTPTVVAIFITGDARAGWGTITITEGTHTATNVVVTVTTNIKYRVLALV